MVDFVTQNRIHGAGHNSTPPKTSQSLRLNKRDNALINKERRPVSHTCRIEFYEEFEDKKDFETYLLAQGLRDTNSAKMNMHIKPPSKEEIRPPDRLLYAVGKKGSSPASYNLNFPRGFAIDKRGDIYVADTKNHRVQVFNNHGVIKYKFGAMGSEEDQFNEPSGIGILANEDIVIADSKNKRLVVYTKKGWDDGVEPKNSFPTKDEPFCVACDDFNNIAVSTCAGTVELYRKSGKFYKSFKVTSSEENTSAAYISVNNKGEIVVSDVEGQNIKFYNTEGDMQHSFEPQAKTSSLAFFNAGIYATDDNELVISDNINHTINLYTEKGELVEELVGPTDDVGAVQTCALGPEGHLVGLEYTINGRHCFKIYRNKECECHPTRPKTGSLADEMSIGEFDETEVVEELD